MRNVYARPDEETFSSYRAFLSVHRWTVVLATLAGLLGGVVLLAVGPKTYSSTTEVLLLEMLDRASDRADSVSINLDTEAVVATSLPVLREAAQLMGGHASTTKMANAVEITVPANTTILAVTYRASTPEAAQNGASAVGQAYLAHRQAEAEAELQNVVTALERQRTELQTRIQPVAARIGSPAEQPGDRSMRNALSQDERDVTDKLAVASATVPLGGRIIAAAQASGHARTPKPVLVLVSGLIAGLVAGLALAAARDRALPRLRHAADITDRTGVPVLAVIRRGREWDHDLTRLTNLVLAETERPDEPVHTFLIAATSPRVRDVARALEQRLRRAGRPTTLLPTPPPLLARVPSQQSAGFAERVDDALHRSDILLLDANAPGTGSLPPLMADGVIAVVDLGDTSPDRLARALAQLHRDHHRVTGVVAVEPSRAVRARPTADTGHDHVA
jgi:capsular polysaccharide biosynthesis protein